MEKYALYCRVSTSDQNNDNQRIRLEEYARQRGFEYDLFQEVESSSKTRPVKASLLDRLRKGHYNGIIVYKLDRYARSSAELILETKELIDKGIQFISITDNIDFSTAIGRLQFQMLSAFAEFERALIGERTRNALTRLKIAGKKLGRPAGSKDKKRRKRSGYILKAAKAKQAIDESNGIHRNIDYYIDETN